ncbi:MAG: hypothetical protein R3Y23_03875 [Bacillota bacterium]
MKKLLEKIVSIALALVSLVFVALIITMVFKPEYVTELNNQLVKAMLVAFCAVFGILTAINIATAFRSVDKLSSVILFKGKSSATRATIGVVKKYVKTAAKNVEGARVTKVVLFVDENNNVKMKADLKITSEKQVIDVVTAVKAHVADTLMGVLGLEFATIDFTTVGVKNKYEPNKEAIAQNIETELAAIEANKEAVAEALAVAIEEEVAVEEVAEIVEEVAVEEVAETIEEVAETVEEEAVSEEVVEEATEEEAEEVVAEVVEEVEEEKEQI